MMYEYLVEGLKGALDEADDADEAFEIISSTLESFDGDLPNDDAEDAYELLFEAISVQDLSAAQEAIFRMEEALDEDEE